MYMRRCLQLASCGMQEARPNPMVGAVIVAQGRIIGEGYHIRCGEAHAEVNAFASVKPADEHLLAEATIYVSLEPCAHQGRTPPCADLIVRKGVRRVVVGCVDPFAKVQGRGIAILREAGIDVTVGVLEEECRWLNRRFFTFHQHRRPYIILKWAQTADGFLDDHGKALAISSPFTQRLVHRLRSECDVILVGRVTEERERPRLNVRLWSGRDPVKRVLSRDYGIEEVIADSLSGIDFEPMINIAHNYAAFEHHFGENVIVHRKGATLAREGIIGIIPGSQGTASYIVEGLGNPESFCSCSHGAGRVMSRTMAIKTLDMQQEVAQLEAKGIVLAIRSQEDMQEATGAYKDIETVIANEADLVKVLTRLLPIAVIKG